MRKDFFSRNSDDVIPKRDKENFKNLSDTLRTGPLGAQRRYLLTICKYRVLEEVTETDLYVIIDYLKNLNISFREGAMESHGMYSQLHWHGIVDFSGSYSLLTSHKGFRIYWKLIYGNIDLVKTYIYKNSLVIKI